MNSPFVFNEELSTKLQGLRADLSKEEKAKLVRDCIVLLRNHQRELSTRGELQSQVTQVELLPCPFCGTAPLHTHAYGEQAAEHIHNDCVLRNRIVPVSKWNTRTPSPATGSAVPASTVAPSPVGEGQKIVHGVNCDCRHKLECEDAEERELHGTFRGVPVAAQASKPASGGGDLLRDMVAALKKTPYSDENCSLIERAENAIAAEADTAKQWACPKCGQVNAAWKSVCDGCSFNPSYAEKFGGNPPAADRLAQTVTDAEVEALRESLWSTWGKDRQTTDWPSRAQLAVGLKAALRARESAPAQEGWVLVPTEPTKAMIDAMADVTDEGFGNSHEEMCAEVWRVAIAAAPRAGGEHWKAIATRLADCIRESAKAWRGDERSDGLTIFEKGRIDEFRAAIAAENVLRMIKGAAPEYRFAGAGRSLPLAFDQCVTAEELRLICEAAIRARDSAPAQDSEK